MKTAPAVPRPHTRGRSILRLAVLLPVLAGLPACDRVGAAFPGASGRAEAGLSLAELRAGSGAGEQEAAGLRVVAEGLDTPWEIRFLPGDELLVTERPGRLVRIAPAADGGPGRVVERHEVPDVEEVGEGGLMGLALHPDFPAEPFLYVCHTTRAGGGLSNRVVRFRYEEGALSAPDPVLEGLPGAPVHDGCRLEFGPEGRLFVTMGDASRGRLAQDPASLAGKILRLTTDGEPAPGNPSGTAVWSLGHRNPQGLAFDDGGRLWSTEHGPSGAGPGLDELNVVVAGANYGWPEITGDERREGLVAPVLHSGRGTWAPSGLAYLDGRLFFAGLRGEALYEVRGLESVERGGGPAEAGPREATRAASAPDRHDLRLLAHLRGDVGRLRAVRAGPDGRLYFGTSNRDGRGNPRPADDRIFALDPDRLEEGD